MLHFKRVTLLSFILAALTIPLLAQDQPAYLLAAGAGFNRYAAPQASGWVSFGVKIAPSTYSYSTIDTTSVSSSIRTGVAQVLIQKDGFSLLALGDAGMQSQVGSVGGAFSTGGIVAVDISKWTKVPGTHAVASVKVFKSNVEGSAIQPVFSFGFAKTF